MTSEIRQHKDVFELRMRLLEAEASGDLSEQRQILAELKRIELRELTPQQRDDQDWHIAQQCASSQGETNGRPLPPGHDVEHGQVTPDD